MAELVSVLQVLLC